ncbi:hypothetical protein FGO68_gene14333 [Halteria grandinella]|uniref:Uncharacterized protein n=1 Tax=Halteria grandinella TaxID=5974 RepID=A0A8J8NWJ9_HALGN|nr:hypothetical protein FGO68_gene14333 [Halteria grandinella]
MNDLKFKWIAFQSLVFHQMGRTIMVFVAYNIVDFQNECVLLNILMASFMIFILNMRLWQKTCLKQMESQLTWKQFENCKL